MAGKKPERRTEHEDVRRIELRIDRRTEQGDVSMIEDWDESTLVHWNESTIEDWKESRLAHWNENRVEEKVEKKVVEKVVEKVEEKVVEKVEDTLEEKVEKKRDVGETAPCLQWNLKTTNQSSLEVTLMIARDPTWSDISMDEYGCSERCECYENASALICVEKQNVLWKLEFQIS